MKHHFIGKFGPAFGVITVVAGYVALSTAPALAAQPWYCICKGETKRFLASTRHCENQMHVPKGKYCTTAQTRQVYAPACRKMGCKIKPFD